MNNEYPASYVPIVRLYNSHVLNPADSFESVASSLFGVQSQVFNASAIAFAVRTKVLKFSELKQELAALHLIRLWGIRTTIHIYDYKDWDLLLSYLSITDNWYKTKILANGIDLNSIVETVVHIIKNVDYFDRNFLINKGIGEEHLGPWGDLLIELNNRGYIFHHTDFTNKTKHFGSTQAVFGNKIDCTAQLSDLKKEIILRFFHAYAPATIYDFAHWLGISIRDAKEYLRLINDDLTPVMCGNKEYYIESTQKEIFAQIFQSHIDDTNYLILPKFDPLLLAYHDKSWITEKHYYNRIWKIAGHVEGVVLQHGKAIATWRYKLTCKTICFEVLPFRRRVSQKKLEKCFRKIARYFERPIGGITFKEDYL